MIDRVLWYLFRIAYWAEARAGRFRDRVMLAQHRRGGLRSQAERKQ
jgi:hypothetical protein